MVALPCCLLDLACFFLPSFSTLIKTCIIICLSRLRLCVCGYMYVHVCEFSLFSTERFLPQLANKGVFIFSLILNKGILHSLRHSEHGMLHRLMVGDRELIYHWCYLLLCLLGWLVHEFLYSVMVSSDHFESAVDLASC